MTCDASRLFSCRNGYRPGAVKRLVDRFDQDRKVFLASDYKEEQLRPASLNGPSLTTRHSDIVIRTFSSLFFAALGWDMDNKQGLSEFSVMPADVLGQVYEQFLGKVIRLTAGHQAKVEEKPEVRKAGGPRPARLTSASRRLSMQPMSAQGRSALTGTARTLASLTDKGGVE